ncbi:MAG: ABC transporter ATP-binding protein [Chloroflexota bacterium]
MEHHPTGAISIRRVGKAYDARSTRVMALDDCSVEIAAGEFHVLVGPSGCGKTTLLNVLAGFEVVSAGEVYLDGQLLAAPGRRLAPGADRIVVFQNGALFPWKTVLDNVACGPIAQGRMRPAEAKREARTLLARVGLQGIEDQYPGQTSSGMRRRVEIVRALINDPKVLLLDEPFRALDAMSKGVMHEYLLSLYDMSGKTILFITHDLDEAIFLGDRVSVMTTRPGRVKQSIEIGLPRPRDYRLLTHPTYLACKQQAMDAVHEEAQKAFEAGERELA